METVEQVPRTGGEQESLVASLRRQRAVVRWKLEGLDDEQVRRAVLSSGTSLLGLVKHLASVEAGWFCAGFGRPAEEVATSEADPDADFRVEAGESTADVLAYHDRACRAADAVVAELPLEATGRSSGGDVVSMRWVLLHMIEENARHAGHADVLRELLDGRTGDYPG
jgi:uncharacterized damage-inducible protein DinB